MNEFDRFKLLVGEDNFNKVSNLNILVIGIGGVGGYVVESLSRSGVNNLTLVDFDKVDITNINRQIIANYNTIGNLKTDEFKNRMYEILFYARKKNGILRGGDIPDYDFIQGKFRDEHPEIFIDLRRAFEDGDMAEFTRLSEISVCIVDALIRCNFMASMKGLLKNLGIGQGFCREPFLSFNNDELKPIIKEFTAIKEKYNITNVELFNKLCK